jgi:hypothetical protein
VRTLAAPPRARQISRVHRDHGVFVDAIQRCHVVRVVFARPTGERVVRRCVPLDYGPYQHAPDWRYHLLNLEGPSGRHPMGLPAARIVSIADTGEPFDPATTITWSYPWHVPRSW